MLSDAPPPYGTVVFDCDSTLSAIEGVDELAGEKRDEVEALTRRAMNGELSLDQVYGERLDLILATEARRLGLPSPVVTTRRAPAARAVPAAVLKNSANRLRGLAAADIDGERSSRARPSMCGKPD